jgi:hypothetical protein
MTMPKLVITHRVEDVAKWKAFDAERETNLSTFAEDIRSYAPTDGGDQVAVSMDVHDPDGLSRFMESETCASIMRRHGVVRPVSVFSN